MFDPQIKVYLQEIHGKTTRMEQTLSVLSSKVESLIITLSRITAEIRQLQHNQALNQEVGGR